MSLITSLRKKVLNKETSRFILAGSINTLFCYVIFSTLLLIGLGNTLAMTIATLVTIFLSYFLMGRYVFVSELTVKRSLIFLVMQGGGYAININTLRFVVWVGLSEYLAGVISLLTAAVFTYFMAKHVVFLKPVAHDK
jgi:putative flippase GtrA